MGRFSEVIPCRHCHNVSKMEILGDVGNKTDEWEDTHCPGVEFFDYYEVLKCPKCNKVNIRRYSWSDLMDGEDVSLEYEYLYPTENHIPEGLPPKILKAFTAADLVKAIDVNAYVILLRRLLEMVCHDQKAKANDLAKMLQELANKNVIPQNLVKVAIGLKDFGNIGAHPGLGELSEEEIPIVKALTLAILEYVYSAPYLADLASLKLADIKKKKK